MKVRAFASWKRFSNTQVVQGGIAGKDLYMLAFQNGWDNHAEYKYKQREHEPKAIKYI